MTPIIEADTETRPTPVSTFTPPHWVPDPSPRKFGAPMPPCPETGHNEGWIAQDRLDDWMRVCGSTVEAPEGPGSYRGWEDDGSGGSGWRTTEDLLRERGIGLEPRHPAPRNFWEVRVLGITTNLWLWGSCLVGAVMAVEKGWV